MSVFEEICFVKFINYIKSYKIEDYKIMAALCFDNIGIEKWKLILHELPINDIINLIYYYVKLERYNTSRIEFSLDDNLIRKYNLPFDQISICVYRDGKKYKVPVKLYVY